MKRFTLRAGLALLCASTLAACGGGDGMSLPAAKSEVVIPEVGFPCAISKSSIQSLVTKGTGLAFNGATFGSVGTFTYICTFHPNMVATVVVTDSSGAVPTAQTPQIAQPLAVPTHGGNGSSPMTVLLFGGVAVAFVAFLLGRHTSGVLAHH